MGMIATTLFAVLLSQAPSDFAKLVVTASGFRDSQGVALFQVYGSADDWLEKAAKTVTAPIKDGKAQVTIVGLWPGPYGVAVTHDANKNGKMDMAWFPYPHPDEGGGMSNDAKASLGPPSWEDARLALKKGRQAIAVKIGYY